MTREEKSVVVLLDRLSVGGVSEFALNEARALRNFGVETQFWLLRKNTPAPTLGDASGLGVPAMDSCMPKFLGGNFKVPGFAHLSLFHLFSPMFFSSISPVNDRIFISHGTYTCFSTLTANVLRGTQYLAFIHDPISYILPRIYAETKMNSFFSVLLPLGCKMDRAICDHSEAVLIQSNFHRELLSRLTKKPIHTVYPGVEAAQRLPIRKEGIVLAVSRWERGKDPGFIISVARKIQEAKSSARFLVVGPWTSSALRSKFMQMVHDAELDSRIIVRGYVNRSELTELYQRARCVLHPRREAFGMVALEAAAQGTPCVMPAGSGASEIIPNGEAGFFPDEGDVSKFAEYVRMLADDEQLSKEMGKNAWTIARQYSWKAHAKRLAEIVQGREK
jgi:glycosyltransferase involved in cell wall biosynthesis